MTKLCAVLAIFVLGIAAVQSQEAPKCGVCQSSNDALCESETSYYNCFNGVTYGDLEQCDEGTVCSNSANICEAKDSLSSTVVNVCGSDSISGSCNHCGADNKYTCVSRTQAGRCIKGKVAAVFNCAENEICVSSAESLGFSVCMPKCAVDYTKLEPTCSSDEYIILTTTPAPTPSPADRARICQDASTGVSALYFYTYADSTCKVGLYCQRNSQTSTDWISLLRPCSAPTPYFDTKLKSCAATKPASCLAISTTTSTIPDSTTTSFVTTTTSGTVTSDTTLPVTTTPDTITSDTNTSDNTTPDNITSDTNTSDNTTPDTITSDNTPPVTTTPDTITSDNTPPVTTTPDTITSDTNTSDTTTPDTITSDNTPLVTTTPDTITSDTNTSDTTTPDTITSDNTPPVTTTPDTLTSDTNTSDTTTPDTITSDTNTSDTTTPDTAPITTNP